MRLAELAHDIADVAEKQFRDGMCLLHVFGGLAIGDARRHIQLQAQCGQVMAERVMEIARDAEPLLVAAALGQQRTRRKQFRVRARQFLAGDSLTERQ